MAQRQNQNPPHKQRKNPRPKQDGNQPQKQSWNLYPPQLTNANLGELKLQKQNISNK